VTNLLKRREVELHPQGGEGNEEEEAITSSRDRRKNPPLKNSKIHAWMANRQTLRSRTNSKARRHHKQQSEGCQDELQSSIFIAVGILQGLDDYRLPKAHVHQLLNLQTHYNPSRPPHSPSLFQTFHQALLRHFCLICAWVKYVTLASSLEAWEGSAYFSAAQPQVLHWVFTAKASKGVQTHQDAEKNENGGFTSIRFALSDHMSIVTFRRSLDLRAALGCSNGTLTTVRCSRKCCTNASFRTDRAAECMEFGTNAYVSTAWLVPGSLPGQ